MAKRQRSLERDRFHAVIHTTENGRREFVSDWFERADGEHVLGVHVYLDEADAESHADQFDAKAHARAVEVEIHIVGELRGRQPGKAKHE